MELFKGKQVRSVWDNTSKKHWFSVVDVCAVLRGCDYHSARNYWKWLKNKLTCRSSRLIKAANQLKLEAADGKLRFTDVMDIQAIMLLIRICPSPKAAAFKTWLAGLADKNINAANSLAEALVKVKDMVRCKAAGLLKTIYRKEYCLVEEETMKLAA